MSHGAVIKQMKVVSIQPSDWHEGIRATAKVPAASDTNSNVPDSLPGPVVMALPFPLPLELSGGFVRE